MKSQDVIVRHDAGSDGSDAPTRRVVMLAYPDAQVLDITGPLEVFARAARWLDDKFARRTPAYTVEIVGPEAGPIRTSGTIEVIASRPYRAVATADTVLVSGGIGYAGAAADEAMLDWLRTIASNARRVGSICNGALVLAAAGLLDGRRATTHWAYCDDLKRRAAGCTVEPDAIHVRDGSVYTSAGVTAGMDLALALVEADWGRAVALRVAQELVMYLVRPGGQSQFSRHLEAQQHDGRLGELALWIVDHLAEDLPVERMADIAGISPRHFARRFAQEFGMPPAAYVARLRVDRARTILEAQPNALLKTIARDCGFGNEQNLRRAFARTIGITPEAYRERFCASGGGEAVVL